MENRALIALALSFVVFIAFIYLGGQFKQTPPPPAEAPQIQAPAKPVPPPLAAKAAPPPTPAPAGRPAREVVVDTPLFKAVFTEAGARLVSFQLKKYRQAMPIDTVYNFTLGPVGFEVERFKNSGDDKAKPKELVRPGAQEEYPLGLAWEGKGLTVPATLPYQASAPKLELKPGDTATLTFTGATPQGVSFTRTFTFKADTYSFDQAVKVANHSPQALEGSLDLSLSEDYTAEDASKYPFLGFLGGINKSREEIKTGGLKEPKVFTGKVDWAGLDEGYFLTAVIPGSPKAAVTVVEKPKGPMLATVRTPVESLAPGQDTQFNYTLYFGPKDLDDLNAVGLASLVDFGWFDFLGKPFLYSLKFFERYTGNYGWAIVILTIILRIVFFYPNHKSYKSMKDMQKLQPKVAKIREKYKDDKEAMNKELMALYRTFKVNPLAGCMPMAMQLPVFIALYNVLGYAIELRHATFIATLPFTNIVWLADLSAKDPLLITPIIMGASMVLQQKMTPSPGDPAQAKMMMFLPIIFTFMFLNFASGLVIYWLVNNILSIAQQYYTNKHLT
jgi:YidC/Oxa1 family membrane protein insertase